MESNRAPWKDKVHDIIFGHDTKAGKAFDLILMFLIITSIAVLMIDSVDWIDEEYGDELNMLEWGFTILFTIEYILRLITAKRPKRYAKSFFGTIDLVSTLPTYLELFMAGSQYLQIIRTFRLLRVFRILGLSSYVGQASILGEALKQSRQKIIVFFGVVLSINIFIGTLMFLIEGPENGFTNIPKSIYWAIVTMTTVGYGDITPQTALGQSLAAIAMIIAYAIIAVPTGIVTLNLKDAADKKRNPTSHCPSCHSEVASSDSFCSSCGHTVNE